MQVNGPEGRNEQGRNSWQKAQHVWLYTDLLQALKGERFSTVFSPDGTLISASAAPHCGKLEQALRRPLVGDIDTVGRRPISIKANRRLVLLLTQITDVFGSGGAEGDGGGYGFLS